MADTLDSRKHLASYDLDTMNPRQVKRFDPAARAAAKQAARAADTDALASGKKSEARLHRENGLLAFPRQGLAVDFVAFVDPNP